MQHGLWVGWWGDRCGLVERLPTHGTDIQSINQSTTTTTITTEIASEGLKGRVFEVNLAELQGGDEEQGYRKFKLVAEDVKGTDILTNFHGMDLTREKLNSLIKKWQTLIDAHVEAKTTDGYTLRLVRSRVDAL